jgi:phage-related minor tail protein
MSSKLPSIPDVQGIDDPAVQKALSAVKETVEQLTGRRGSKIAKLGPTSTLAAVILKVNELLDKLQS